ncbi:sugar transferase [Actinocatenispora rupis]|uniref:sugar transferase n=1 Tax=Actinocatenispora rupis TaxID=519421 RepID=UPI001EF27E64|nr:sugar transferase [Actinocatenispora rupis]
MVELAVSESPAPPRALPARAARPRRCGWENRYLRVVLAADVLVALAVGAVAFGVRFGVVTTYNQGYLALAALLPAVWALVLGFAQAYDKRHLFVGTAEYQRVLRAGVTLAAGLTFVSYAADIRLARGYVVIVLPLTVLATVVVRFALRKRLHRARSRGRHLRRVVVMGHRRAVADLCRQLRRERYHGLEVVGACVPERRPRPTLGPVPDLGVPVYGTFADAPEAVTVAGADTVVVLSCPELDGVALRRLGWQLERDDVDLIVASALIDVAGGRTTIRPVDGLPMLHVEHARLRGSRRVAKEIVDRCGAALLLVGLAPLLAAVALLIRADSPGPALFRQPRVGRGGALFDIVKFRTMYTDAEARLAELRGANEGAGVLFKMRDDPRVTRVGRYLRRFSLDELPQLVNVLAGQMSLVGPRPPLPAEVAEYPEDMLRRLVVKPGLTGLWQVSGRSDLPWEEAIRLDLRYVENWSLSLDLVILLRTVTAVVRTSGAY